MANAVQALSQGGGRARGVSGRVYNVGTGRSITVLDLVAELNQILGTSIKPTFGPTRIGDVRFSRADITQARKDLGYQPDVTFRDGLARTVRATRET